MQSGLAGALDAFFGFIDDPHPPSAVTLTIIIMAIAVGVSAWIVIRRSTKTPRRQPIRPNRPR
jgi:uncharacterized membrane protein (DUF106 family)